MLLIPLQFFSLCSNELSLRFFRGLLVFIDPQSPVSLRLMHQIAQIVFILEHLILVFRHGHTIRFQLRKELSSHSRRCLSRLGNSCYGGTVRTASRLIMTVIRTISGLLLVLAASRVRFRTLRLFLDLRACRYVFSE